MSFCWVSCFHWYSNCQVFTVILNIIMLNIVIQSVIMLVSFAECHVFFDIVSAVFLLLFWMPLCWKPYYRVSLCWMPFSWVLCFNWFSKCQVFTVILSVIILTIIIQSHYAECHFAECRVSINIVIATWLNKIVQSVIVLNVIMLRVMAPQNELDFSNWLSLPFWRDEFTSSLCWYFS